MVYVMVYAVVVDLLEDGSNLEGNTLTLYTPLPAQLDAHRLQKMLNAVIDIKVMLCFLPCSLPCLVPCSIPCFAPT